MFNPASSWQSDAEYHSLLLHAKARFSSDQRIALQQHRSIWDKMSSLELDPVLETITPLYPEIGRPAKNQSQIIRSLLLFTFLFGKTLASFSLTLWVNTVLPGSNLMITMVGCRSADDLPPLGSYYDFMHRLWNAPRTDFARHALLPAGKNGKKPKKLIGPDGKLVEPEPDTHSTVDLKNKIIAGEELSPNPESFLEDFFYLAAVLPSIEKGLIPTNDLTISGDGTAVATHASHHGVRQKGCTGSTDCPYHKDCPRHYSDPEAEWGWDSHEKNWYFGRTLYMLCTRNKEQGLPDRSPDPHEIPRGKKA